MIDPNSEIVTCFWIAKEYQIFSVHKKNDFLKRSSRLTSRTGTEIRLFELKAIVNFVPIA